MQREEKKKGGGSRQRTLLQEAKPLAEVGLIGYEEQPALVLCAARELLLRGEFGAEGDAAAEDEVRVDELGGGAEF